MLSLPSFSYARKEFNPKEGIVLQISIIFTSILNPPVHPPRFLVVFLSFSTATTHCLSVVTSVCLRHDLGYTSRHLVGRLKNPEHNLTSSRDFVWDLFLNTVRSLQVQFSVSQLNFIKSFVLTIPGALQKESWHWLRIYRDTLAEALGLADQSDCDRKSLLPLTSRIGLVACSVSSIKNWSSLESA